MKRMLLALPVMGLLFSLSGMAQTPGTKVDETTTDAQYYYSSPMNQILVDPATGDVTLAYTWSGQEDFSGWTARINKVTEGQIYDLPSVNETLGMGSPDIRRDQEGYLYISAVSAAIPWFYHNDWGDGVALHVEDPAGEFTDLFWYDQNPWTGDPKVFLQGWHLIDDDGTIHYMAYDGWGYGVVYKRSVDGGLTFGRGVAFGAGNPPTGEYTVLNFPCWGSEAPIRTQDNRPYGFQMASNGQGKVAIVGTDQGGDIWMIESTDGGATWPTEATNVTNYGNTFGGTENARPQRYIDAMYDKWGDLHIVWEACYFLSSAQAQARHPYPGNGPLNPYLADYKDRLNHWSPATGINTVVISQAAQTDLDDRYVTLCGVSRNCTVNGPTMAYDYANDVIYVGYVQFTETDSDTIPAASDPFYDAADPNWNVAKPRYLAYGDVHLVKSVDGGTNWQDPVNVTDTPGFDERYLCLNDEVVDGKVHMIYFGDENAGVEAFGYLGSVPAGVYHYAYNTSSPVEENPAMVTDFTLNPNYPNPFNPVTSIAFSLPKAAHVDLAVYNINGQRVKTLISGTLSGGAHEIEWDGTDARGRSVSGGLYFYRIDSDLGRQARKMTLMK